MRTINIPGFIHATPAKSWQAGSDGVVDGMVFDFWTFEANGSDGCVTVCPHTLSFDIPEGWDPRPDQIKALEAAKESLRAEFAKKLMRIDAQISRLQAIEYTPEPIVIDDEIPF